MSGWNPREPTIKKEVIDVVNEFWWKGCFSRSTKITQVIESLAREIISLRKINNENQEHKEYLFNLLKALGEFPVELSNKAALGDNRETYEAFNEYMKLVTATADKRSDIFIQKTPEG